MPIKTRTGRPQVHWEHFPCVSILRGGPVTGCPGSLLLCSRPPYLSPTNADLLLDLREHTAGGMLLTAERSYTVPRRKRQQMQELGKLFGVRRIEAKKVQRVRKTVHLQNLVLNVHAQAVERICGSDVCQQNIARKSGTGKVRTLGLLTICLCPQIRFPPPEGHRSNTLSTVDSLRHHCKLGGGSASIPSTSV